MFIATKDVPATGFYTYVLVNPLTNLPFYVGKGSGTRYLDHFKEIIAGTAHNKHKANTIKKIIREGSQVIVDIVCIADDEQDCFEKEKQLIEQYGRKNNNTGILTNLTNGGEGVCGFVPPDELRRRWSKQRKGPGNGMYGRTHTPEAREKIKQARKEHIKQGKIIPFKHTEEHKQKLRINNPGGKATSKPIYQINTTGEVIKTWPSSRSAGTSLGFKSWRNLSALANSKRPQTAYGFYWRWANDDEVVNDKLTTINTLEKIRKDNGMRSGRPIEQICPITHQTIHLWKNMCEAAKELNIDNSAVSYAVNKQTQYAGFFWRRL